MSLPTLFIDSTVALRTSEEERRELSLGYQSVLNRLWKQSTALSTLRERS